jgi:GABA permease
LVAFSSIFAPDTIFAFLLSCSGGVILLIYSLIVTAHIVTRKAAERTGQGRFVLPLFPLTNYATIAGVAVVFGAMLCNPTERMTAVASLGTSVVCFGLASYFMMRRAD